MPPEFPQAPDRRGHERAQVAQRKGTGQGHWAAWRALSLHPPWSTPRGHGRQRPAPDSRVPPLQEEPLRCRTREQVGRGLLVPRKPLPALAVLRPRARFCLHIVLLPARPAGSPPHPVIPSSLVHPPPLVPGFSPGKCFFPSARASKGPHHSATTSHLQLLRPTGPPEASWASRTRPVPARASPPALSAPVPAPKPSLRSWRWTLSRGQSLTTSRLSTWPPHPNPSLSPPTLWNKETARDPVQRRGQWLFTHLTDGLNRLLLRKE